MREAVGEKAARYRHSPTAFYTKITFIYPNI